MTIQDRLEQMAREYEDKAQSIRTTIGLLNDGLKEGAKNTGIMGKITKAAKLRSGGGGAGLVQLGPNDLGINPYLKPSLFTAFLMTYLYAQKDHEAPIEAVKEAIAGGGWYSFGGFSRLLTHDYIKRRKDGTVQLRPKGELIARWYEAHREEIGELTNR